MTTFNAVHIAWLFLAIGLEIVANIFLKYSNGFRRPIHGVLSLAAVLAAFSALSQAVKGIDLSVAYALWGGPADNRRGAYQACVRKMTRLAARS